MTQLSAFVGVTGLVLTGFLLLARLSQRVVDDSEPVGPPPTESDGAPPTVSADTLPTESDDATPTEGDTGRNHLDARGEHRLDGAGVDRAHAERPPGSDFEPAGDGAAGPPETPRADPGPTADAPEPPQPLAAEQIRDGTAGPTAGEAGSVSAGALLANVALTQGLFGGLLAAAAWYFGVSASALGLSGGAVTGPAAVGVGVAFGVVLWAGNELATGLADAVGATYDEELRTTLAPEGAGGWALLLAVTLPVIAVVEEFLFRAAAVGAPAALVGTPESAWALAAVSSVAFALGHGAQGRVGVVVTGALGFALAAGFVLSGSFVVVVVAHYLVNALEFVLHEGVGLPDPVWS